MRHRIDTTVKPTPVGSRVKLAPHAYTITKGEGP